MRLTIRLFAAAAEAVGARECSEEFPEAPTAAGLLEALARRGGPLLFRCTVAMERRIVSPDTPLRAGAEIAVLPPVSGGSAAFRIGPEPISADAILAEVADPDLGGQVLFLGTVRQRTDDLRTARLEYEAYADMAVAVLEDIAARARGLWPGCRVAMWHRVGTLRPGEPAVAVAAAAAHRGDAFAASRFCIERLKVELPVWKKEVSPEGRAVWADHP